MSYESYILPSAQRDIKKLSSKETQESVLKICMDDLEQTPRPHGYEPVKGVKGNINLYRVYSDDRKFRIIYSIEDDLLAVIIVAVRRRREGTYKDVAVKSLSHKVKEIAKQLKVTLPRIRNLAAEMGIEWISVLNDKQTRCLEIGTKAINDGRSSSLLIAEKIKETIKLTENVKFVARDIERLLQKM